ncbi:cobalt ECF transporter T component CbiQ [Clostridium tyrobutyricum]|uniref:cobalt ECF transporter T component CbiQ n=1 Tax=Clostridium tyrobutyricum TaxID=1519 RepID=UPI00057CB60F|nr:cobalt ECF transporter T component CbiQ [Clostridium tyrobutyricum]
MELSNFNHFNNLNTPIHRMDGRIKTVLFLSSIIIAAVSSHWYFIISLFLISLICFNTLKIPWNNLLIRLILPFAIAWLVFLSSLFTNGSHILTCIYLGSIKLNIYREGLQLGFIILLRIITAVSLACILSLSTPMIEILETLRILKIPSIIIDIADMMYRYLFIIEETAQNMKKAQLSRLGDSLNWINKIKDSGKIALYILIKSLDKSTRIYKAMLSRGYSETSNTINFFNHPIPKFDLYLGIFLEIILISILILNILI